MGFTERREHTNRRQPRSSANDLYTRLEQKIAEVDERRQEFRRETDRREPVTPPNEPHPNEESPLVSQVILPRPS